MPAIEALEEAEAGGWLQAGGQVGGQPGLSNKFQASQCYLPRCYWEKDKQQLPRTQGLKLLMRIPGKKLCGSTKTD